MSQNNEKRILWTAGERSLPKEIWGRLEEMGFRVLLGRRDENILGKIRQLSPKLWVDQIDGEPESGFSAVGAVRRECPAVPIVLLSQNPNVEDAVRAVKMGVVEYFPHTVPEDSLWAGLRAALQYEPPAGPPRARQEEGGGEQPIATDPSMRKVIELAERIGPSRSTVLIQGESGTGKEVVARYIHRCSERKKGPFVAVNCAALPETLLESELFGHERGAFTGAVSRKRGKFEVAGGGTLLLDEISETPLSIQAKLLRVLQEREIDRVGGELPLPVDTRVVATTNRDLESETRKGNFRLDLYYRLNVVPIFLPPLRERPADLLPLANLFLKNHSALNGLPVKRLSRDAAEFLKRRSWPGNVRELENLMERSVLLIEGDEIAAADLQSLSTPASRGDQPTAEETGVVSLREMEKRMIQRALQDHQGNRTHAAEILGISVRTLRNKLQEYRQEMTEKEPASSSNP